MGPILVFIDCVGGGGALGMGLKAWLGKHDGDDSGEYHSLIG